MIRPVLAFPVLAVALALAVPSAAKAPPRSGLYGVVIRGPTMPVCQPRKPCSEPAPGLTLLFERAQRVRGRVTTGVGGRYRIELAPGVYEVRATKGFRRVPSPPTVRVVTGRFLRIDFFFDTGIR
jgi:hypothetical protein